MGRWSISAATAAVAICVAFRLGCFDVAAQQSTPQAAVRQGASPAAPQQNVELADHVQALASPGEAVSGGGINSAGDAYPADQLGASITWSGETFTLGTPGPNSGHTSRILTLPPGHYLSISLLGTAVEGNQETQTFIVNYTDGTSSSITQSLSDWQTPQGYDRESIVRTTSYKILQNGAKRAGSYNLYGYTFEVDSAKTVQSLALPNNRNVVVLAVNVMAPATPPLIGLPVNLRTVNNLNGIGIVGTAVANNGLDGLGNAFATDQLGASLIFSNDTFIFAPPGAGSAVTNRTISLPQTKTVSLTVLGNAVGGKQLSQKFVVTYTDNTQSTFTQSLSDWNSPQSFTGESVAKSTLYRVTKTGAKSPASTGKFDLYAYTFTLNSAKTAKTLTLPANGKVVVLAVDVVPLMSTPAAISVPLTPTDNVFGIAAPGTHVTGGGVDGLGDAYASDQLGSSLNWFGKHFVLAPPGANSAVASVSGVKVVPLPIGKFTSLSLLAAATAGHDLLNQVLKVTYTDGTTSTFTQSFSDWQSFNSYQNQAIAADTQYVIKANGTKLFGDFFVFGYNFNLNSSKAVKSLTLPNNKNIVVLAMVLSPGPAPQATPPSFSPSAGTYSSAQAIDIFNSSIPGAVFYYTTDGSTPTTASTKFTGQFILNTGPGGLRVTTTVKAITVANAYANSAVATATYKIGLLPAAAPTFSPAPGIYATVKSAIKADTTPLITLSDATAGAQIFFTTDGSQPTTSSKLYSVPFAITAGAVNRVKAIAVAPGFAPSLVATGTYTVTNPPSDLYGGSNAFLLNKYSLNDGCLYYVGIGVLAPSGGIFSCILRFPEGSIIGGITFAQWKAQRYDRIVAGGATQHAAKFINLFDLNLTRDHHAVMGINPVNGRFESAAYVCNHPGPDFYHGLQGHATTDPDKTAQIDAAIQSIQNAGTLVACVAIDYGINTDTNGNGVNGGQPFMRFLVFDAFGNLLPGIDLDNRGQKSVPNACSACHGIPFMGAGVSVTSTLQVPNGGRYIPFDAGNLAFSSQTGLRREDQEAEIKELNRIVLFGAGNPGKPISDLIHDWYDSVPGSGNLANPTQPLLYEPSTLFNASLAEQSSYFSIYGPTCRSCHVANGVQAFYGTVSGGHVVNVTRKELEPVVHGDLFQLFNLASVCHPGANLVMPNAKTSFDRLWSTHVGPTANDPDGSDQIAFTLLPYYQEMNAELHQSNGCNPPAFPNETPNLPH